MSEQRSDPADAAPLVGIIMGSTSDAPVMAEAAEVLSEFGVRHELRVVSAHRSPQRMVDYAHDRPRTVASRSSSPAPAAPLTCPAWSRR